MLTTATAFQKMLEGNYSHGFERDPKQIKKNDQDHRKWSNPLEVQLPNAPDFKIYCLYVAIVCLTQSQLMDSVTAATGSASRRSGHSGTDPAPTSKTTSTPQARMRNAKAPLATPLLTAHRSIFR